MRTSAARFGRGLLLLFTGVACIPQLGVPDEADIRCATSDECPRGRTCSASRGVCVQGDGTSAPVVTVGRIPRAVATVTFPVTVVDDDRDEVALRVEVAEPGGAFAEVLTTPASVSGTPEGSGAVLTWDALADRGAAYVPELTVRVTPSDSRHDGVATTATFAFGNDAPVVSDVSVDVPPSGRVSGNAVVRFVITDRAGDVDGETVDLERFVVSERGDFSDATEVPLTPGPTGNFPGGALTGLGTGELGREHSVTWRSEVSAPWDALAARVQIEVRDAYGAVSAPVRSDAFALDNQTSAPAISLQAAPSDPSSGDVVVGYRITDLDGDLCQLRVDFSLDAVVWTAASSASQTTELLPGDHTFVWQSVQLGYDEYANVRLRLRVDDPADPGNELVLDPFTVDNRAVGSNQRPLVQLDALGVGPRPLDEVPFDYDLVDVDGDACSLSIVMSTNDGATWFTPLEATMGSDGVQDLSASLSGERHRFVWNALDDPNAGLEVGAIDPEGPVANQPVVRSRSGVRVRLSASDPTGSGIEITSPAFSIGDDPPMVAASVPGAPSGLVVFDTTLIDPLADMVDVHVSYSLDGVMFDDATVRLTSTTTVSGWVFARASAPGPGGLQDVLTWDSTADAGPAYRGPATLRLLPRDAYGYGTPATTSAFEVHNNTPPLVLLDTDLGGAAVGQDVSLALRLVDDGSDFCQVDVFFAEGPAFALWTRATLSTANAGLPSGPAPGASTTLVWQSAADLDARDVAEVRLRFVPADVAAGVPVETPSFRVDNLAPAIVSYTSYDDDSDARIDRVAVTFSEPVRDGSLVLAAAFVDALGRTPSAASMAGDDDVLELLFDGLGGTAPIDLTYLAAVGQLEDLLGNPVTSLGFAQAARIDAATPWLLSAVAAERPPSSEGGDDGDVVFLAFSEPVTGPIVDASSIDALLALSSGHSWRDGGGAIGAAQWSGAELAITLSAASGAPSIDIGDSITPAGFADAAGLAVQNARSLAGSFSSGWQRYDNVAPSGREKCGAVYDGTRQRLLVLGGMGLGLVDPLLAELELAPGREVWGAIPSTGLPATPSAHAVLLDPIADRLLTHGGSHPALQDSLWALDLSSDTWGELQPSGVTPTRSDHCGVYDPVAHRWVLYGGQESGLVPLADVWTLSLEVGSETWAEIVPAGEAPEPRMWPACALDPTRHRLLIVGGLGSGGPLGDAWALDLLEGAEAWQALDTSGGPLPPRDRAGAAIDTLGDRLVLFGGNLPSGATDEVWALDLGAPEDGFALLDPFGLPPSPRLSAVVTSDPLGGRLVVFGGGSGGGSRFDDTYELSFEPGSETWSRHEVRPPLPAPRTAAGAVVDPIGQRLVVFGGVSIGTPTSEVYALDLTAGVEAWSTVSDTGTAPSPRSGHGAIYDPLGHRMIVFGGEDIDMLPFDDVHALSLDVGAESWTPINVAGGPSARARAAVVYDSQNQRLIVYDGTAFDSTVYALDLSLPGSESWSSFVPAGTPPNDRSGAAAVFDPVREQLVFYGGQWGDRDVYLLSLSPGSEAWSHEVIPLGPGVLSEPLAVYDSVGDRVLVYGGYDFTASVVSDTLWALELAPLGWVALSADDPRPGRTQQATGAFDPLYGRLVMFGGVVAGAYSADTWWY